MLSSVRNRVLGWRTTKFSSAAYRRFSFYHPQSLQGCNVRLNQLKIAPLGILPSNNGKHFSLLTNAERYTKDLNKCSEAGDWKLALQILEEMHQYDEVLNDKIYGSAIKACEIAKEWDILLHLYESMNEDSVIADKDTLYSVANACAQSSNWDTLDEVIEFAKANSIDLDVAHLEEMKPVKKHSNLPLSQYGPDLGKYPETYIEIVNQRKTNLDVSDCLTILKTIAAQDFPPTAAQYAQVINYLIRIGAVSQSLGLLYQMEHAGYTVYEYVYEIALKKAINVKDAETAVTLIGMMRNNNYELTTQAYSDVTGVCFSCNRFDDIHELRKQLKAEGFTPTGYMYFAGALAYERAGDLQNLLDLIMEAHEHDLITNDKIYTTALHAFDKTKQYEKVLELYNNILSPSGKGEDPHILPIVAKAAAFTQQHELVDTIVKKIQNMNVAREESLYTTVLLALSRAGKSTTLDSILAEIKDYKIPMTPRLLQMQVVALAHHKKYSKAIQYIRSLTNSFETTKGTSFYFNAAFRCLAEVGHSEQNQLLVRELLKTMKQESFYPQASVSSRAVSAALKQELNEDILCLFRDAPTMKLPADVTSSCLKVVFRTEKADGVKSLLRSLQRHLDLKDLDNVVEHMEWSLRAGHPEYVIELCKNLKEKGIEMIRPVVLHAIKANYILKNYGEVVKIYESLDKELGNKKTGAYMYISNAYCRLGEADAAYEALQRMQHLSILSFNHVLFAYLRNKNFEKMDEMMNRCEELQIVPDSFTYSLMARSAFLRKDYAEVMVHLEKIENNEAYCNAIFSMIQLAGNSNKAGAMEGVKVALALLSKRDVGNTVSIKTTAIEAYSRYGMSDEIFDILPQLPKGKFEKKLSDKCVRLLAERCTRPGIAPTQFEMFRTIWNARAKKAENFTTLSTAAYMYARGGDIPELIDTLGKVNAVDALPHFYWDLYKKVLTILSDRKDWNSLLKIYRMYGNKKCATSNVEVLRACMHTKSKNFAVQLANDIAKAKAGDIVSLRMLNLCRNAKGDVFKLSNLNQLVIYMLEIGIPLSKEVCDSVIQACLMVDIKSELFETFKQMKLSGMSPDMDSYGAVINACTSIDDLKAAGDILDLAREETR